MLFKDIITFRDDLYFEGAVQADWCYQLERTQAVASSFVFHGPSTHAVTQTEVGGRGLIDTASFALKLAEKANGIEQASPFTLAIAGYGTGKSHLAVTLSSLLAGEEQHPDLHRQILANISRADSTIANKITPLVRKPRLVLTLNGMRDFNLHYELLRTAEKALRLNHADLSVLTKLNKVKEIAQHFLDHTFALLQSQFIESAQKHGLSVAGNALAEYLASHLDEQPSVAFDIINEVYTAFNGHEIRLDEGVSASAVLDTLLAECCGIHGHFESIVVLFDEFGRYLEYVAANPAAAGDSALQQIFESVQNAQGDIQFVGFIQSDIKSYLQRVDKSSNISRYIDRYDASEKVYLSSNLETIFANLLERTDLNAHKKLVLQKLEKNKNYWKAFYAGFSSWLPLHGIWSSWEHFSRIILQAIYPLHPISTYLLCRLTDWLQNRSSLTLLSEKVKELSGTEVGEGLPLPMIYPVDLLNGPFFEELLSVEEQGRQRSQFCILLNNILRKFDTKLSSAEKRVLLANLTLRVCRFRFTKRAELDSALAACANLTVVQVQAALKLLEDEYAVLSYDDRLICFDFVADSVGANDFRNYLRTAKNQLSFSADMLLQEDVLNCAGVSEPIQTKFGVDLGVQTSEWTFAQRVVHVDNVDQALLDNILKQLRSYTSPTESKGLLSWVYVEKNTSSAQLEKLTSLISRLPEQTALCLFMLDDAEDKLKDAIIEYRALSNMSSDDRGRFHRFYADALVKAEERISLQFADLKQERKQITASGVVEVNERMASALSGVFRKVYPKAVPFDFDGFQNKSIAKACKQFCAMMKWILMEHMKFQTLKAQPVEVRNRIESLLGRKGLHSWRAVNDDYSGVVPMNDRVRNVYQMLSDELYSERTIAFGKVLTKLTAAPYGMNDYAVFLMLSLLSENLSHTTKIEYEGARYSTDTWAELVLSDKKIDMRHFGATTLHLVDVAEAENRFKMLFREINNNIDMTLVAGLKERLEALEKEESIPESLESDHVLATLRLSEGEKAMEAFDNETSKILKELSESKKNHDAYAGMHAASAAYKLAKQPASQSEAYTYNDAQMQELVKYFKYGKKLAEEFFDEWIPTQRCDSLGHLSAYEKHVKRVIELMNSLKYTSEARKLRSIADQEVENIRILTERQSLKENCDIYLQTSSIKYGMPIMALEALKNRGNEILKVFESFNYQQVSALCVLHEALSRRITEIQEAIDNYRHSITALYGNIKTIHTLADVRSNVQRINVLLDTGLTDNERNEFENFLHVFNTFLQDSCSLEECGDDLKRLSATCESLKATYYPNEDFDLCPVIDSLYDDCCARIHKKAEAWAGRWLEIDCSHMDERELDHWKRSTQPLPLFVDDATRERYDVLLKTVEAALSEQHISYIVMLYNRLDDSEKQVCLERLKD